MNIEPETTTNRQGDIEMITELVDTELHRLSNFEREDIKKIVKQTFSENLPISECFFELNERLDYILGMDTMKFVKRVINHYRQSIKSTRGANILEEVKTPEMTYKPCEIHKSDEAEISKTKNTTETRHAPNTWNEAPEQTLANGTEVIFNEIPESINEDKLRIFCEKLGEIEFIKRLNNIKYLIKFKEESSAFDAVDYRGPIYGVFLKKYFNNFSKSVNNENRKENIKKTNNPKNLGINTDFFEKILKLLRRQDVIVDQLYIKGEDELATELNEIKNEIKNSILKTKRK